MLWVIVPYEQRQSSELAIWGMWSQWPEPVLQAECLRERPDEEVRVALRDTLRHQCALHLAGERPCREGRDTMPDCGIYLMPSPGMVWSAASPFSGGRAVVAMTCWVRAWGIVAEYERGWRAQFVQVLRVWASPMKTVDVVVSTLADALRHLRSWGPDVPVQVIPSQRSVKTPRRLILNESLVLPSDWRWWEYCTWQTLERLAGLHEQLRAEGLEIDEEGYLQFG